MDTNPDPKLLELIYAAAADPKQWTEYLQHFARELQLNSVTLTILYPLRQQSSITAFAGANATPEAAAEYATKWSHLDPWISDGRTANIPVGQIIPSQQLCPDEILENTEIYKQFLGPNGFHYGGGVSLAAKPYQYAVNSCARSKASGPLSDRELAYWRALVPHLIRAVDLQGRLQEAESERDLFRSLFEGNRTALILTNENGAVMSVNQRAETLLRDSTCLALDNGHLTVDGPSSTVAQDFESALRQAGFPGPFLPTKTSQLLLPRESGQRPLFMTVSPFAGDDRSGNAAVSRPTVLIEVIDPSAGSLPEANVLRELFDLTPAEANICLHLASGLTVEEIASTAFVSENTVRTHMKRCLSKTQTRRQGELIALVHRIAAQS